jgi:radical SAM-linked protein
MARLLFEKRGNAVWISHLDLMRLFQRAFKRAGLPLTHSGGFTPRPQVSIALPLSVGVESNCELLDFDLDGQLPPMDEIRDRLNAALVPGVRVLDAYQQARKIRDLALLECSVSLEYDNGIPAGAQEAIASLFARESLTLEKKGKNGVTQQDIIPMIRRISVAEQDSNTLILRALICCQNPSLNPAQLVHAVETYLPCRRPDHAFSKRNEIYSVKENVFR